MSSSAQPVGRKVAIVRHVGDSSRGPFVVIDSGQTRGYVIGTDICFYDDHGNETTCGTIERSSPRAAGIRIERHILSLIRVGDRAWFKGMGPVPEKAASDSGDQSDVDKMLKLEESAPPILDRRWYLDYSFAPSLPVAVNALKFDASARASGNGSVWSAGAVQKLSPVGMVAGVQLPKAGDTMQQLFFGYQFLPQSPIISDYDLTDASQTIESKVTGHFYRLGVQIGQSISHSDTFNWSVAGGLDIQYITHKFSSTLNSDTTLVSGSMRHFLLAAPLSTWCERYVGGWALRAGLDFTIPMVLFGGKKSGEVQYAEVTTARSDMSAVESSVDPRKNLGFAVRLGLGSKF